VVSALSAVLAVPGTAPVTPRGRARLRIASVLVAVGCAAGLAYLGLQMVLGLGGTPLTVPRTVVAPTATQAPSPVTPTSAGDQVLPLVSVSDFDPFGTSKQENPKLVPLAVDADPSTAWLTVHYKAPDMSGKPGVGLLVDLGAPRPVSAVSLRLVGNGTDLSLLATDDPTAAVDTFTSMAQVTGAGQELTLRVPRPVTTRYVVVWLTSLPSADGSYQGGIADLHVLG
jgi:putative peptidoglycan lipid II flippase